jgi:ADP-L-glycero-D-manno-heptose 6-epimerase
MIVFVTGHAGFIGQNMVNHLQAQGIEYRTYDPITHGAKSPHELDLNGVSWVIHLGAISSTTETDVKKVLDVNVTWSIQLFEACEQANINFQWASSASVYGDGDDFREHASGAPLNLYARSKWLLEQYVMMRKFKVIHQGFRYFNVYGDLESHKGSQASPHTQFTHQAKQTGVIRMFDNSHTTRRDFVHVDQVIRTHELMWHSKESGIWNVGTGMSVSFAQVAAQIAHAHAAKVVTTPFPEHLVGAYQYHTCADVTKLNTTLAACGHAAPCMGENL